MQEINSMLSMCALSVQAAAAAPSMLSMCALSVQAAAAAPSSSVDECVIHAAKVVLN